MSIATEITRITGLRNRIRNKLISLGLMSANPRAGNNDLEDCVSAVEAIEGTKYITDTNAHNIVGKHWAMVDDDNLSPLNIKKGVMILGVNGELEGIQQKPLANNNCEIVYGGEARPDKTIMPPEGYSGFPGVSFSLDDDRTLLGQNIKKDVMIMGVNGECDQSKAFEYSVGTPSTVYNGSKDIEIAVSWGSGFPYAPYYSGECFINDGCTIPRKRTNDIRLLTFSFNKTSNSGETMNHQIPNTEYYYVIGMELGWDFHALPHGRKYMIVDVYKHNFITNDKYYRLWCHMGGDNPSRYDLEWNPETSTYKVKIHLGGTFYHIDYKNLAVGAPFSSGDDIVFLSSETPARLYGRTKVIW